MKLSTKRLLAYIIDTVLILIIIMSLKSLLPQNKYEHELGNLNENYIENKIEFNEYKVNYINIIHNIDKSQIGINILLTILLIISFVIIPLLNKGQTLGCKLMKIRITSSNKLNMDDLIKRSIIMNGTGYMFLMFIILFFVSSNIYFILINIFAFLQIIVVIVSGFMVLYSKQHQGIADILTKTRIEEIK
ncbi:MAG: RDD family protein [Bacilli bacterium]